jgi:hypothetical protein
VNVGTTGAVAFFSSGINIRNTALFKRWVLMRLEMLQMD